MTKIAKLTFNDFAGLLTGRIARIHGAAGTSVEYNRVTREFVFENRQGQKHMLSGDRTNEVRLDAHFHGFQINNGFND